ncbi:MAG TPA: two-component sensor histidine kinase, partial [Flavobacterium sp.]|nr:two-component sensor histidine kinase [Flavobacterium sp.]
MNKLFFRLLVVLMSLSLLGIILVQVYWFNSSLKNNDERFRLTVKQVIGNVADNLRAQEANRFLGGYSKLRDSIGKEPMKSDLLKFYLIQTNSETKQTIVYSNSVIAEDYGISAAFFGKKLDSVKTRNL